MTTYVDTFDRADTAAGAGLGSFSDGSGKAWSLLAGTAHISGNKAVFESLALGTGLFVIDAGNADFTVEATVSPLGGDGLFFRVVDASNWWRLYVERGDSSVPTGRTIYTCVYGPVEQLHSHTFQNYNTGCANTIFHDHNGSGGHHHQLTSGTSAPEMTTLRNDFIVLERDVAGAITRLETSGVATVLTVVASGDHLLAYADGTLRFQLDSAIHHTATKVGIGRGPSEETGTGIDSFSVTPSNLAGAIAADYPLDGATTHDATPDLGVRVTDADAAQTLTVTWEVDNDAGFGSLVDTGTDTAASPKTDHPMARTVATPLAVDVLYHWRANVNDGGGASAWVERSFYVNRTPVATNVTGDATVPAGRFTLEHGYTDADGDPQDAYQIIKVDALGTTYWSVDDDAWVTGSTWNDGDATETDVDLTDLADDQDITFTVRDEFGSESAESAVGTLTVHDLPVVSIVSPASQGRLLLDEALLTVVWNYSQAQGVAQAEYAVVVKNVEDTTTYAETGWVGSDSNAHVFDMVAEEIPLAGPLVVDVHVRSTDGDASFADDTTGFEVLVEKFRPPFSLVLGSTRDNVAGRIEHFGIREGDTLPMVLATVRDRNGDPLDLIDVDTVRFRMRTRVTRDLLVDEPASVDDAGSGLLRFTWEAGHTDRVGRHVIEFELTFDDGRILTVPNDEQDEVQVIIREQLA